MTNTWGNHATTFDDTRGKQNHKFIDSGAYNNHFAPAMTEGNSSLFEGHQTLDSNFENTEPMVVGTIPVPNSIGDVYNSIGGFSSQQN